MEYWHGCRRNEHAALVHAAHGSGLAVFGLDERAGRWRNLCSQKGK